MKVVTADDFESEVLKSDKPVLVDFYADWCGPCKVLSPILGEIANEKEDSMTIVKVDVDASSELAKKYYIKAMPTLLMFRDGEVIARKVGGGLKSHMDEWLNTALALPDGTVVDLEPKRVTLSDADKTKLTEEYRKVIDASPDADKPIPGTDSALTLRQEFEAAVKSGELFTQLETAISEGDTSLDDVFKYLEDRQNANVPKGPSQ